jgi:hypothetical protein
MSAQEMSENLIRFESLSLFSGNNPEFERQLIDAFLKELTLFRNQIKTEFDEPHFVEFRRAYHSISPSFQMLQMHELINAVEDFKLAYSTEPGALPEKAQQLFSLIDQVQNISARWLSDRV